MVRRDIAPNIENQPVSCCGGVKRAHEVHARQLERIGNDCRMKRLRVGNGRPT